MKNISTYIFESNYDGWLEKAFSELTDNVVLDEIRSYLPDTYDLDSKLALDIWYDLRDKLGYRASLWSIKNNKDIDKYEMYCNEWVSSIIKKYKYPESYRDILRAIAYMVNGL